MILEASNDIGQKLDISSLKMDTSDNNYRPVSIRNIMSKIFDKIMARKLPFICKDFIISEQHDFISG